jgi:hypothetical protein
VELQLHSPNTSSWRAQVKHRDTCIFTSSQCWLVTEPSILLETTVNTFKFIISSFSKRKLLHTVTLLCRNLNCVCSTLTETASSQLKWVLYYIQSVNMTIGNELVELYLHSSNTPSWCGPQLKQRDNFNFTFYSSRII